jgi:hypothetical protein
MPPLLSVIVPARRQLASHAMVFARRAIRHGALNQIARAARARRDL